MCRENRALEWQDKNKDKVLPCYISAIEVFSDNSVEVVLDILDPHNEKYQTHYLVPKQHWESMDEGLHDARLV